MFAALVTNKSGKYRGFDRDCELYANAPMSALGRISAEAGDAWEEYINLHGGGPIPCTEEALAAMNRVVHLCEANRREFEIVLYTPDMGEAPGPDAAFLGFDVASSQFASLLSGGACCALPERFSKMLNGCGLLDSLEQAEALAEYANGLSADAIEPDCPYVPIRVFLCAERRGL